MSRSRSERATASKIWLTLVPLLLGTGLLATPLALYAGVSRWAADYIHAGQESAPDKPIAIVFGAGIQSDGALSQVLADRVGTAVELYQAGKVRKLLLTGDNRFEWYNEPGAMGQYAMARGVPAADIVYDYAGRRTYDSCYRARHIFGVEEAILVTQEYHLPRALYTARNLGIDAVGVAADRRRYSLIEYFTAREMLALAAAWWDIHVAHLTPVMGEPIEIHYD